MSVLLLLLIAVYIRGEDVCNIKMCLTWTVQHDHLELICKVSFLKYHVEFYNNNDNEQGYCLSPKPTPKCITKYPNTVMTQNTRTNVTYLKILDNIDGNFNGKWECRHGTNRDKAFVNITVLHSDHKVSETNDGPSCSILMMLWCFFGFACCFLTTCVILVASNCDYKKCGKKFKNPDRYIVIAFLLSVTLFAIPLSIGRIEEEHCVAAVAFFVYGAFVCIVNSVMLIQKGDE